MQTKKKLIKESKKEKGVDLEDYGENKEITGEYDKTLGVKCHNGTFVGVKDGNVIAYKGIPYAKPPIGQLRFRRPEELPDDNKIYEAFYLGKTGFQTEAFSEQSSYYKQGEDCLKLNVWKNTSSTIEKKPVMVFFHGGSFSWGGTADPLYEGTNFVKDNKDVILVTANYRINILGYINLSPLKGGEDYPDSGNLGTLDNIYALKWVKKNIENFGGDSNNVTIFGESAGGCITSILPLVKESKGLFQHVIAESGSYIITNSIETSIETTKKLMEFRGYTSVDDLLRLSEEEMKELIDEFVEGVNSNYIFPIRDGVILPKDLCNEYDKFDFSGIDFIFGTNKDEYRYWVNEYGSLEEYQIYVRQINEECYNQLTDKNKKNVDAFYELIKDEQIWKQTEFINEYLFRIPAITQAEKICKRGGKVYMYFWNFPSNIKYFGACHAVELAFVFNNLKNEIYTGGNVNQELATNVQQMWVNFAKTGNPSIEQYKWEPYDLLDRKALVLGKDIHLEEDIWSERRKLLSFLAQLYVS